MYNIGSAYHTLAYSCIFTLAFLTVSHLPLPHFQSPRDLVIDYTYGCAVLHYLTGNGF